MRLSSGSSGTNDVISSTASATIEPQLSVGDEISQRSSVFMESIGETHLYDSTRRLVVAYDILNIYSAVENLEGQHDNVRLRCENSAGVYNQAFYRYNSEGIPMDEDITRGACESLPDAGVLRKRLHGLNIENGTEADYDARINLDSLTEGNYTPQWFHGHLDTDDINTINRHVGNVGRNFRRVPFTGSAPNRRVYFNTTVYRTRNTHNSILGNTQYRIERFIIRRRSSPDPGQTIAITEAILAYTSQYKACDALVTMFIRANEMARAGDFFLNQISQQDFLEGVSAFERAQKITFFPKSDDNSGRENDATINVTAMINYCTIFTELVAHRLVFVITIPIIYPQKFEMWRMIPIPIRYNNRFVISAIFDIDYVLQEAVSTRYIVAKSNHTPDGCIFNRLTTSRLCDMRVSKKNIRIISSPEEIISGELEEFTTPLDTKCEASHSRIFTIRDMVYMPLIDNRGYVFASNQSLVINLVCQSHNRTIILDKPMLIQSSENCKLYTKNLSVSLLATLNTSFIVDTLSRIPLSVVNYGHSNALGDGYFTLLELRHLTSTIMCTSSEPENSQKIMKMPLVWILGSLIIMSIIFYGSVIIFIRHRCAKHDIAPRSSSYVPVTQPTFFESTV